MAAQVLSGSGNVTYTNSTGQNVRIVINYLRVGDETTTMTFQGVTQSVPGKYAFGKTLATREYNSGPGSVTATMAGMHGGPNNEGHLPLEVAISNGETFSIIGHVEAYNIIVIPEAG